MSKKTYSFTINTKHLIITGAVFLLFNGAGRCIQDKSAYVIKEQKKISAALQSIDSTLESMDESLVVISKNTSMKDSIDQKSYDVIHRVEEDLDKVKMGLSRINPNLRVIVQEKEKEDQK